MKKRYFSKSDILLWAVSVLLILSSFLAFEGKGILTLAASLVGVTSLIFNAKGNPFGQVLMIVFSILYGIISWSFAYYGEMITYLGMTAPMALIALVSWLKHSYNGNKREVRVHHLRQGEAFFMLVLTFLVTVAFYFILKYFNTANLIPSTLSIATSFLGAYLTFKRSPLFALAYAANNIVLILLWILAAFHESSYISVIVCFFTFLLNDLYGFWSWVKMERRQKKNG